MMDRGRERGRNKKEIVAIPSERKLWHFLRKGNCLGKLFFIHKKAIFHLL